MCVCVCVCLSLVKTSAYGFGTRSLATFEKTRERRKEKPRQKLERVWFDAQSGNPHSDVLCVRVCIHMCVFVLVAMHVWHYAYACNACMGTHIWILGEM